MKQCQLPQSEEESKGDSKEGRLASWTLAGQSLYPAGLSKSALVLLLSILSSLSLSLLPAYPTFALTHLSLSKVRLEKKLSALSPALKVSMYPCLTSTFGCSEQESSFPRGPTPPTF